MLEQKRFVKSENAFKLDAKSDLKHGDGDSGDIELARYSRVIGVRWDQALLLNKSG